MPVRFLAVLLFGAIALAPAPLLAVEGMFPVSELGGIDLSGHGLEVDASEIYDPGGLGLIAGICKVGGCTGSFVSDQGLILTNHHCAFRALQNASSDARDWLTDGFLAATLEDELPAKGYTVRITESYRDVSAEVLSAVTDGMSALQRTKATERRRNELELEAEAAHPGKRAEVAEMFQGRTYVLFLYTWLKDVRLAHAPPRAIGEFGGERDNWIWPRHTGDYAFMRAYVAPDGTPAEYAPENVPYRPRKVLEVSPRGVDEGDPVFLFGYPGKTFRHQTSYFLDFEARIRMPFIVDWYGWMIDRMEARREEDPTARRKLSSRVQRLSNVQKRYRGQLQGIERLDLVERWRGTEKVLQAFIESDDARTREHGDLLSRIGEVHRTKEAEAGLDLWLEQLRSSSVPLSIAFTAWDAAHERAKPEVDREGAYQDRNWAQTVKRLELLAKNHDEANERVVVLEFLRRGGDVAGARELPLIGALVGEAGAQAARDFVHGAFDRSRIHEPTALDGLLPSSVEELAARDDPVLDLMAALYPSYLDLRQREKAHKGELDALLAELVNVQMEFLGEDFLPDANGTLRMTLGRVEGYAPRDGVWHEPVTRLRGVLEKAQQGDPYAVPERLVRLSMAGGPERSGDEKPGDLPVCLLYSADTTGGSSGSPIFDARGRLVGVNFDRAWEATINDFAWDAAYSRSIGVDIRYVLWLTGAYSGAERLLEEMGLAGD